MKTLPLALIVVVIIALGGWYWWSHQSPAPAASGPQQGTTVNTNPNGPDYTPGNLLLGTDANATLGTYLIDSNGMTLYTYNKDTDNVSNCSGQCAVNWPPYTATADVLNNIQAGISGKAGLITRADGTTQVTYNGMPLYLWVGDTKSGDTTGQGVNGFVIVKP